MRIPLRLSAVPALRQGSRIRVIAPSGAIDPEGLARGLSRLRTRYEVICRDDATDRHGYLAGDDARRRAELVQALEDPTCEAIVAARGGYGATRLLDSVPTQLVRENPKLLVGFSDITALHAAWHRAGLRSVHGSMAVSLGRGSRADFERWCGQVEGTPPPPIEGLFAVQGGKASGPLCGGNLAIMAALLGTPHAPTPDDKVLFFEDIGERPFRIDRLLDQFYRAGWFQRAAGVVFGEFTDCLPNPDGVTVDDIIQELGSRLHIPVLAGIPSGHGEANHELHLGAGVEVDGNAGKVTFLEGAVYNSRRR